MDQWLAMLGSAPRELITGTMIMASTPQAKPMLYRFMPFWIL